MSNESIDNDNIKSALESLENTTVPSSNDGVTGVEVIKGDTAVYKDGDFDDYNVEQNIESDKSDKEDKYRMTITDIYQWASKLKDDLTSGKGAQSDSDDKEVSDKEANNSVTITNIYQWASKLKDDFASEASTMVDDVSEKAVAIMLKRLLDNVDTELEAFDKNSEGSEEISPNAEDEREKILAKKDKYQNMIDQLQS